MLSGVLHDDRWDNDDLHNLSSVPASAFEVVQMNPIYTAANVPQGSGGTGDRQLYCRKSCERERRRADHAELAE